jgi:hypothetical protein
MMELTAVRTLQSSAVKWRMALVSNFMVTEAPTTANGVVFV